MSNYKSGQCRIIGGLWRGRKINVPDNAAVRPSGDRMRETLFNWLQQYIGGANCLDLFAGSGVIGIEALSRGANNVVFVDLDRKVINHLKQTLAALDANNAEVIEANASKEINHTAKGFDIIFLDPPFDSDLLAKSIAWLQQAAWLNDNALIYIETDKNLEQLNLPQQWQIKKQQKQGKVNYFLLCVQ